MTMPDSTSHFFEKRVFARVCELGDNCIQNSHLGRYIAFYQSPLILTALFQHDLINVSYLTACYLYQVMMTLHFLNDVANDAESTQK